MSDTPGAEQLGTTEQLVAYLAEESIGYGAAYQRARAHDAEDARRENRIAELEAGQARHLSDERIAQIVASKDERRYGLVASTDYDSLIAAYAETRAALRQARALLERLLHWDSFHDPAGPWLDWITHWKAETEDCVAAIDALEVR